MGKAVEQEHKADMLTMGKDRLKDPEASPRSYSHLVKGAESIHWKKRWPLLTHGAGAGKTGYSHAKECN